MKNIEKLRCVGLRPTKQRLIIADLLFNGPNRHFSAEDLQVEITSSGNYMSIGTVYNCLKKFKKWHSTFIDNLSTSIKLHKINKLIVINHRDCGAAKIENSKKKFTSIIENKIHKDSFKVIKKTLNKKFPNLKIYFKILSLKD